MYTLGNFVSQDEIYCDCLNSFLLRVLIYFDNLLLGLILYIKVLTLSYKFNLGENYFITEFPTNLNPFILVFQIHVCDFLHNVPLKINFTVNILNFLL